VPFAISGIGCVVLTSFVVGELKQRRPTATTIGHWRTTATALFTGSDVLMRQVHTLLCPPLTLQGVLPIFFLGIQGCLTSTSLGSRVLLLGSQLGHAPP
jgi:hypothetical protein